MDVGLPFILLKYTAAITVIIPLSFCLRFFKTLNFVLRVLFLYLVLSMITDAEAYVMGLNNRHNYFLRNWFTMAELGLLTLIYYKIISGPGRALLIGGAVVVGLLALFRFVYLGGWHQADNVINTSESWFMILTSGLYFLSVLRGADEYNPAGAWFLWLNAAFLMYFSMAFFLFLFTGYLERCGLQRYYYLYSLHFISNIAFNILLSIGIWKQRRS